MCDKAWASAQHLPMPCPTRSTGRRPVRRTGPHRHRWHRGGHRRSLGRPLERERSWPARGTQPPPGHGRCSFATKRGLTGEQYVRAEAWRDARLERCPNHPSRGDVLCTPRHLRAQDPARREGAPLVLPREPYDHQRAGRLSGGAPGGHARRSGKRWWLPPRRRRAWRRRRTRCAAPRTMAPSSFPARCAGCAAGCASSHHVVSLVIGLLPNRLPGASPRWARCAHGSGPIAR